MKDSFNELADWVATQVAKAWFFMSCVALVVVWAPSIFLIKSIDTWQLIINTMTTIITFLLVALLHNTQERFEDRTDQRLQALMAALNVDDPISERHQPNRETTPS